MTTPAETTPDWSTPAAPEQFTTPREDSFRQSLMGIDPADHARVSLTSVERWLALGAGLTLITYGLTRRSTAPLWVAIATSPLLYRGLTGTWPEFLGSPSPNTREALAGDKGIHVKEAIRLEVPADEIYRFWRQLENLPRFMAHLERVIEHGDGRSHWIVKGPGGVRVEWDAELTSDIENRRIGWRSLPGSDVVTAGSVTFDRVRNGRSTQVTVNLQYAPPAGIAGDWIAWLFGRAPSQTIREDLRRLKQFLEAGELARSGAVLAGAAS